MGKPFITGAFIESLQELKNRFFERGSVAAGGPFEKTFSLCAALGPRRWARVRVRASGAGEGVK
jgi:hypothetical protein